RGVRASRTAPIGGGAWGNTSKRARRTELVMRCKFSQQSWDRFRLEHTLSESLNAAPARGDDDAPADEATLRPSPSAQRSQCTWNTSLPRKWRDSPRRWASAASDNP